MKMVCTEPVSYARRELLPGDEFEAPASDANILSLLGKARYVIAAAESGEELTEPPRRKRRYRRRDQRAEEE